MSPMPFTPPPLPLHDVASIRRCLIAPLMPLIHADAAAAMFFIALMPR